jgi:hypothetical protein
VRREGRVSDEQLLATDAKPHAARLSWTVRWLPPRPPAVEDGYSR